MHNPASILENYTHKLIGDFDTQTYHLISARRLDLIKITKNKRQLAQLGTFLSRLSTIKLKESEKKDKNLDLARDLGEMKKNKTHKSNNYTYCNWFFLYSH